MVRTVKLLAIFLLCQVAAAISALRMLWTAFFNQDRCWKIALSYDRLGNAAMNDDVVQTISSRAAKARDRGDRIGCILCRLLDSIQPNHCTNSIEK